MNPGRLDSKNNRQENREEVFYPVHREALLLVKEPSKAGNFSLWYNKNIPIEISKWNPCNPDFIRIPNDNKHRSERNTIKQEYIEYYYNTAKSFFQSSALQHVLYQKHAQQCLFLQDSQSKGLHVLEIWAKTSSRFLSGIGNSHPAEISITLDHNLGIPYIPASTIKGILRFNNAIELLKHMKTNTFNDVLDEKTKILFGSAPEDYKDLKQKMQRNGNKGSAIFLDVYPIPPINIGKDIINPHYGKYYDPSNKEYPTDWMDPVPVKFLVIEPGTVFVFRCVFPREYEDHIENIFTHTFSEGIGAKTSLGYGRFEKTDSSMYPDAKKNIESILDSMVVQTKNTNAEDSNKDPVIHEIASLIKDKSKIGQLVKKLLDGNYPLHVYIKIKEKLLELNEWEPQPGPSFQKMSERNKKIEQKIALLEKEAHHG